MTLAPRWLHASEGGYAIFMIMNIIYTKLSNRYRGFGENRIPDYKLNITFLSESMSNPLRLLLSF